MVGSVFLCFSKSALSLCIPYEMCYTNKLDLTYPTYGWEDLPYKDLPYEDLPYEDLRLGGPTLRGPTL